MESYIIKVDGNPGAADLRRALAMHEARPAEPFSGPIVCNIRIGISRAQALAYQARRFPVGHPDALALTARALDCGTGIFWRSRSQIVGCNFSRHYTALPYIEFEFYEICTPEDNCHAPTTIARGRT